MGPSDNLAVAESITPYGSGHISIPREQLFYILKLPKNAATLFLWLLGSANWKQNHWHDITIKRGQLVTSLGKMAEANDLSIQNIRTAIKQLQKLKLILSQKSTQSLTQSYTTVTVCEYDSYVNGVDYSQHTSQQEGNTSLTTTEERKKEIHTSPSLRSGAKKVRVSKADPRSCSPQIQLFKQITNRNPSLTMYDFVIEIIAEHTLEELIPWYQEAAIRGKNGASLEWLTWFKEGKLPDWMNKQQTGVKTMGNFDKENLFK